VTVTDDDTQTMDDMPLQAPAWKVRTKHVGDQLKRRIEADEEALASLSKALDVVSCDALVCDVDLSPSSRGRYAGTLKISARCTQTCVITVEPITTTVDETVDAIFWPQGQIDAWDERRGAEAEVDETTPDPEPILDDTLDIGALVLETLIVAIDPHPRKPDAEMGEISTETEEEREAERPFAALAKLRSAAND